jgi:hypothetical protein
MEQYSRRKEYETGLDLFLADPIRLHENKTQPLWTTERRQRSTKSCIREGRGIRRRPHTRFVISRVVTVESRFTIMRSLKALMVILHS